MTMTQNADENKSEKMQSNFRPNFPHLFSQCLNQTNKKRKMIKVNLPSRINRSNSIRHFVDCKLNNFKEK